MLASGEVQRDLPALAGGHDAAGEHARAFVRRLALQPQHAHAGVVVVHHLALRRLPDQLIPRRFDQLRGFLDDLPLRRRRQRNPQLTFQLFQPVERQSRCRT